MRYQRVLLINPPFPREGGERIRPSAGLGYLAEAIQECGADYDVLDMNLGYQFKQLQEKIDKFSPDLIGMTVLSLGYRNTFSLLNQIKTNYPNIPIIVGGPHVTLLKQKVLEDCPFRG
jgi:anaerobic magnesium-protoporphyrin IX monomethyl ester cyclase